MPRTIAGVPVISTRDLLHGHMFDENGNQTALEGYPTDAMIYYLADDARVIVRPSGTEPKTKCYYEVVGALQETDAYDVALAKTETRLTQLVERHQDELKHLLS
ncbi:MAG: phospho-sugar mutase, partial [Pseudomonadota bacterium]